MKNLKLINKIIIVYFLFNLQIIYAGQKNYGNLFVIVFDIQCGYQIPVTFYKKGYDQLRTEEKINVVFDKIKKFKDEYLAATGFKKNIKILNIINKGNGYYIINFNRELHGDDGYSSCEYSYLSCILNSFKLVDGIDKFSIFVEGKHTKILGDLSNSEYYSSLDGVEYWYEESKDLPENFPKKNIHYYYILKISSKPKYLMPVPTKIIIYNDMEKTLYDCFKFLEYFKEKDDETISRISPFAGIIINKIKIQEDMVIIDIKDIPLTERGDLLNIFFIDSVKYTLAEFKTLKRFALSFNGTIDKNLIFSIPDMKRNMPIGINFIDK